MPILIYHSKFCVEFSVVHSLHFFRNLFIRLLNVDLNLLEFSIAHNES